MVATILTLVLFIIAQVTTQGSDDGLIMKIAIPTGGISGTLYLIWFYTFKQNKKDYSSALKQNQEQFQFVLLQNQEQFKFALLQNQTQFDKALQKIEDHHKENLATHHKTVDRLFEVMRDDVEYKEILTGVLVEIKNKLEANQKLAAN